MTPEEERKERIYDYLACFSTPSGKRVLDDLRKAYGDRTSFHSDPYVMAFNEGHRDVYLKIRYLIEEAKLDRMKEKQTKAEV